MGGIGPSGAGPGDFGTGGGGQGGSSDIASGNAVPGGGQTGNFSGTDYGFTDQHLAELTSLLGAQPTPPAGQLGQFSAPGIANSVFGLLGNLLGSGIPLGGLLGGVVSMANAAYGSGQFPGVISGGDFGTGLPDLGMMGYGEEQKKEEGGNKGGQVKAQAVQEKTGYSLSPQPFGWYGMKRVGQPWTSWPGGNSGYQGGNYGGMKRV